MSGANATPGKSGPDAWAKMEIVSKFLSSVVIAVVGIAVTNSIQKAQIASSRATAQAQQAAERVRFDYQRNLQNSQLTAQLLESLTSERTTRRELAVLALRQTVPPRVYEDVLGVIARSDTSSLVRQSAIRQLADAREPEIFRILLAIAQDGSRPEAERALAGESARKVALRAGLGARTYIFGAAADYAALESPKLGHGVFSYYLAEGIRGAADFSGDDVVTVSELNAYLNYAIPREEPTQHPISTVTGADDTPLTGTGSYSGLHALIIAPSHPPQSNVLNLRFTLADARLIQSVWQSRYPGSDSTIMVLLGLDATKSRIIAALDTIRQRADSASMLAVYYGGHGFIGEQGDARWLVADTQVTDIPGNSLAFEEVQKRVRQIRARTKVIFVDASFALPVQDSGG